MSSIVGTRVDVHCDDACDRDSTATVVADLGSVVLVETDCCCREVEVSTPELLEQLRD